MIIEKDIGDLGFSEDQRCPICNEPLSVKAPDQGPINRFECEKHGEFVLAALLLPKGLLEFVEDVKSCFNGSVDKYLSETLIDSVRAQIESDNMFRPTIKSVSEKYGVNFDC